jgi:hypothetical protein
MLASGFALSPLPPNSPKTSSPVRLVRPLRATHRTNWSCYPELNVGAAIPYPGLWIGYGWENPPGHSSINFPSLDRSNKTSCPPGRTDQAPHGLRTSDNLPCSYASCKAQPWTYGPLICRGYVQLGSVQLALPFCFGIRVGRQRLENGGITSMRYYVRTGLI